MTQLKRIFQSKPYSIALSISLYACMSVFLASCGDTFSVFSEGCPDSSSLSTGEVCRGGDSIVHNGGPDTTEETKGSSGDVIFKERRRLGVLNIIFADDNSDSMHRDQRRFSDSFDSFLDNIADFDYRIAIVTVDISSSPGNVRREYQDGAFIRFSNNELYLHNQVSGISEKRRQHKENSKLFKEALIRPETKNCSYGSGCPEDERAICALNKSLDHTGPQSEFFRKEGQLMVVILSDEDERSSRTSIKSHAERGESGYELEACDLPHNFFAKVSKKLTNQILVSAHSIIIPPGDSSCLAEQSENGSIGHYGELYYQFAKPNRALKTDYPNVREGSVHSICSDNYDRQLESLAEHSEHPSQVFPLRCSSPVALSVTHRGDSIRHQVLSNSQIKIVERLPVDAEIVITTTCNPNSIIQRP